ncbi:MAG TPA: ribosome recycling factor, partial [Pseudomonadales bacterium]|nr:ribosome recycling factor [Pseudomonadales bacterium]
EERRALDEVQKLTDRFVTEIDQHLAAKEKDLMEI